MFFFLTLYYSLHPSIQITTKTKWLFFKAKLVIASLETVKQFSRKLNNNILSSKKSKLIIKIPNEVEIGFFLNCILRWKQFEIRTILIS